MGGGTYVVGLDYRADHAGTEIALLGARDEGRHLDSVWSSMALTEIEECNRGGVPKALHLKLARTVGWKIGPRINQHRSCKNFPSVIIFTQSFFGHRLLLNSTYLI